MIVGITGAQGFLGWHLRCRLFSRGVAFVEGNRETLDSADRASDFLIRSAGTVLHLAGVNRANSEHEVRLGNLAPAIALAAAIRRNPQPPTVVYANSVKADEQGCYGEAKAEAAEILAEACKASGGRFVDIRFPHLFGEFGVPFYNSAVTTFAYQVVKGEEPAINDGQLELVHAQEAAETIINAACASSQSCIRPAGKPITVRDAYKLISRLAAPYVSSRTFPEIRDDFELHLFNMIRSQMWPTGYPYALERHADHRGAFFEATRSLGQGQTSISTTRPGVVRGEHFHFDKIERFVVVAGDALIRVRKLFSGNVFEFPVSGRSPVIVDMPPLCTHDITNVGTEEMLTMFWSHDHFDPKFADTFSLPVIGEGLAA